MIEWIAAVVAALVALVIGRAWVHDRHKTDHLDASLEDLAKEAERRRAEEECVRQEMERQREELKREVERIRNQELTPDEAADWILRRYGGGSE